MVTYRNKNNRDHVVTFPERDARLEALDNWERVDDAEVPEEAAELAAIVEAERRSIEEAAQHRLDATKGLAEGKVNEAAAKSASIEGAGAGSPTLAHAGPKGATGTAAALDKDHPDRKSATASFDENKAAADAEIADPPKDGVLARAKADHREGRTQIGDNPEEHAGPRAAAARKAAADKTDAGKAAAAPAASADKATWVSWAVSQGATTEAANGMTKDQLIGQYGAK
jgi:hypothetical protein